MGSDGAYVQDAEFSNRCAHGKDRGQGGPRTTASQSSDQPVIKHPSAATLKFRLLKGLITLISQNDALDKDRAVNSFSVAMFVAFSVSCSPVVVGDSRVGQEIGDSEPNAALSVGSGSFDFDPRGGRNPIKVFYHRPNDLSVDSRILLVIPGAGRNADSYRDAWVEESEKFSVLILSPMYPSNAYDFGAYHMVGAMADLNIETVGTYRRDSNIFDLDETKLAFRAESRRDRWILSDFDRIVTEGSRRADLGTHEYDAFGHSAGGQILHRFALMMPDSNVHRIVAANSGFYTMPELNVTMPFGLAGMGIDEAILAQSFAKHLIVLVGELDNESETGGTMLRSMSADRQGLHRLSRAHYFFETAKERANEINAQFNWIRVIVPGVGHNHRGMGDAAAIVLYGAD